MASWLMRLFKGGQRKDITEAAGTPQPPAMGDGGVAVNFDLGSGMTRLQAIRALRQIERRIARGPWPPA